MTAFTVWIFDADRTDDALDTERQFKERGVVDIFDAALVRWDAGAEEPVLTRLPELAGPDRFNDAFWSQLFALVFFPASLGHGIGSVSAAVRHEDLGITPELATNVREEIRPGRAGIFLYSSGTFAQSPEKQAEAREIVKGIPLKLISSNLSDDQDATVQQVFRQG